MGKCGWVNQKQVPQLEKTKQNIHLLALPPPKIHPHDFLTAQLAWDLANSQPLSSLEFSLQPVPHRKSARVLQNPIGDYSSPLHKQPVLL